MQTQPVAELAAQICTAWCVLPSNGGGAPIRRGRQSGSFLVRRKRSSALHETFFSRVRSILHTSTALMILHKQFDNQNHKKTFKCRPMEKQDLVKGKLVYFRRESCLFMLKITLHSSHVHVSTNGGHPPYWSHQCSLSSTCFSIKHSIQHCLLRSILHTFFACEEWFFTMNTFDLQFKNQHALFIKRQLSNKSSALPSYIGVIRADRLTRNFDSRVCSFEGNAYRRQPRVL